MSARILAIDHSAELAGGEVALARLLAGIPPDEFDVRVLLLSNGPLVARLRAQGVHVAVIAASEQLTGVGREQAASSVIAFVRNAVRTLALVPRIARAIRAAQADLVVANTLKSAVLTSVAAPLAGRRWVWHLHDRIANDYLPLPLVLGMRLLARLGPRMIVANSAATRATLPGISDRKIVVAYPGVDVSEFGKPIDVEPMPTPRKPPDSLGLMGRIAPTKGQLEFLTAAAGLAQSHPEARFIVVGDALFNDAPFADRVRALPEALGIADRVTFTGWVDDPISAVSELTALVHASPVPEPFGQVLVEAMLAGTPVIGTDAGGVPEILIGADVGGNTEVIGEGVRRAPFGLLVEPRNARSLEIAMRWMLEHPAERATMAAEAQRSAIERFDIRRSALLTTEAWARVLGRRKHGSAIRRAAIVDTQK